MYFYGVAAVYDIRWKHDEHYRRRFTFFLMITYIIIVYAQSEFLYQCIHLMLLENNELTL